jgi:hypothetical protein
MKRALLAGLGVVAGLAVVSLPIFAHHSTTMYDKNRPITLTGTVKEFKFFSPHLEIQFDVRDPSGSMATWLASGPPAARLSRTYGWTTKSLKPGDMITVTGFPLMDGTKVILLATLMGPGGELPLGE